MRAALVCASTVWLVVACSTRDDAGDAEGHAEARAAAASGDEERSGLGAELERSLDLGLAPARELDAARDVEAFGRVIVDPAARFTVRAPIAGTLHAARWPNVGERLDATPGFATVEPRLSAAERLDFAARRADVVRDRERARVELEGAERTLARSRELNAADKSVSDRAVEEAETRVATLKAELAAADAREAALATSSSSAAVAIDVARGGEVLTLGARPGEAVDAGAPLFELAELAAPAIEVRVPLGEHVGAVARVQSLRDASRWCDATVEGRVAREDVTANETLRLRAKDAALSPGEPVVAHFAADGERLHGVELPSSAIVRVAGKSWVYVRGTDDGFVRVEVTLDAPTPGGWLTTAEAVRGTQLVVRGAQSLLSTELLQRAGGSEEE